MPITFTVTPGLEASAVRTDGLTCKSARDLLERNFRRYSVSRSAYARGLPRCAELLQSSGTDAAARETIPQHNGFVDTVVAAYSKHHNLVIRPEDIWLAIMVQFSLYVNRHNEEMREYFVVHKEGEVRSLEIREPEETRHTYDFEKMAPGFVDLMADSLKDKDLASWILPAFTTTTKDDTIIASVVMMATLKSYFRFRVVFGCGFPSVTLLGEKSDYEDILRRLERLTAFGDEHPELVEWQMLLRPVVRSIANSFDDDDATRERTRFWQSVCDGRALNGSGCHVLSGWLSVFCPFNSEGRWIRTERGWFGDEDRDFGVDIDEVASGVSRVTIQLKDNGEEMEAVVVAGHYASRVESDVTLSPCAAWFVYVREEEKKKEEEVKVNDGRTTGNDGAISAIKEEKDKKVNDGRETRSDGSISTDITNATSPSSTKFHLVDSRKGTRRRTFLCIPAGKMWSKLLRK